jgi:DNA modification methylase
VSALILIGDGRVLLGELPGGSVQCVVTSPPYWGLRSYLAADDSNKHLEIGQEPTLRPMSKTWWVCSAPSGGCCTRPARFF